MRFAAAVAGLTMLAGSAMAQTSLEVTPVEPPADVKPGVKVAYWYHEFEHVDQFEKYQQSKKGWTPKPLPALDQCDANGKLYEAGVVENYAIRGEGFIRFPAAGQWTVVAKSNDGIRLHLAGKMALQDPKIHGDRMTKPATVTVSAPGAVPFDFNYFQKKGSACLQLYWQAPGEAQPTLIPAAAFSHKP